MKFKQTLNELQAEITSGGKIPRQRVYINGNIPDSVPPQWKNILVKIVAKLRQVGVIDSFSKDLSPVDIEGVQPRGSITLKADDGTTYSYNVETGLLYDASKKKIG